MIGWYKDPIKWLNTGANPDYRIENYGGYFSIVDTTAPDLI